MMKRVATNEAGHLVVQIGEGPRQINAISDGSKDDNRDYLYVQPISCQVLADMPRADRLDVVGQLLDIAWDHGYGLVIKN